MSSNGWKLVITVGEISKLCKPVVLLKCRIRMHGLKFRFQGRVFLHLATVSNAFPLLYRFNLQNPLIPLVGPFIKDVRVKLAIGSPQSGGHYPVGPIV